MPVAPNQTKVTAFRDDLPRLADLAMTLTNTERKGRFGQAETIRYLLDEREDLYGEVIELRERLHRMTLERAS